MNVDAMPRQRTLGARLRAGTIGVGIGVALLVYAISLRPPRPAALMTMEGPLTSVTLHTSRGRNSHVYALFRVGDDAHQFYNIALRDAAARGLTREVGRNVAVTYDANGHHLRGTDAVETYGLIINGLLIEAEDEALSADRFQSYAFAAIALMAMLIGVVAFVRGPAYRRS